MRKREWRKQISLKAFERNAIANLQSTASQLESFLKGSQKRISFFFAEGFTVKIGQLKLQAEDGKMRITDVADTEQLFDLYNLFHLPRLSHFNCGWHR